MFYRNVTTEEATSLVVLTPSESKRLIARAVRALPEVRQALREGMIVIIGGTTNAFVLEELLSKDIDKVRFAAGLVARGRLDVNRPEERIPPVVLKRGEPLLGVHPKDAIKEFTARDVYIKGANAVDTEGNAAVFMADPRGGTIGAALGVLRARGANLIVPVGLEKLVPSVKEAAPLCGIERIEQSTGEKVGLMPIVGAKVVTELDAVDVLFGTEGVRAVHVASGGVAGSEGAVVLALTGKKEGVRKTFHYITEFKGEPPLKKN